MIRRSLIQFNYIALLIAVLLWLPVSGFAAVVTAPVAPGLNVIGVTAEQVAIQQTAFPLLSLWKASGITAIESYHTISGKMQRAELDGGGNPSGVDFSLLENSALYVYSNQTNNLYLGDSTTCGVLNLTAGFNLASHACLPPNYHAADFLTSVGLANITSLSRLDVPSGRWQTAAVDAGAIVGDDFLLVPGEGYLIQSVAVSGWASPLLGLTPATLTVWQGEPAAALAVTLTSPAPTGGTVIDLISSDPTLAGVASQVTVLQGNTSVSVPLTLPDTGITAAQTVTVTASRVGLASVQSTLSVRPKPTINLSPLSTLTGLTFTYLLTVNLSDVAPPGGFPVTLTAVPAGIVTVPASVIIPAGTSSVQVNVTATAVGGATVTATSPGRGISGSQHNVTVKPIQTMNYGPLTSPEIGIQVGNPPVAPTSANFTYSPVTSAEVGVSVGSIFTGILPNHGAIGSTSLSVTITGIGLNAVTGISFYPATGITVGTPAVAPDGLSATVLVNIAANAPVTDRTVVVSTASGNILPSKAGTDIFKVTYLPPEIYSIQPLRSQVGQTVAMAIYGKNLNWASNVDLVPSTGIVFTGPPVSNADGTSATVTFIVAADAPLGNRVITITTPGGTSTATASETNSFSITSDAGATHTALVSTEVGVIVQTPGVPTTAQINYSPVISSEVGVAVGSIFTSVSPNHGAIGSTALPVTINGIGLNAVTGIALYPATGITLGTTTAAPDGLSATVYVDIAADAPVTDRTLVVSTATGNIAPSGIAAQIFKVTYLAPELQSIQPLRGMVGQNFTLTISGKNLSYASSVNFTPATGIHVNPPSVNAAGTQITVIINIAADASLGSRVVTVVTPGGVSNGAADTTNTFTVTSDLGTDHTPLISTEVGVMVVQPDISHQVIVNYNNIASTEIGVMVTPADAPTSQNVNFGPIVSTQVGVAVGSVFNGFSPRAMEPGSSATYTVTGVGLDTVTSVSVVPSADLTVTAWTPAGDGLTGTVTISADAGAVSGTRTLVMMAGGAALMPSAAGIDNLNIGYKPIVNSITTTFPASSVEATVGTTYTLTLNGVHLQDVTKIHITPTTGIIIDTVPIWFSDATGEHVSVKIVVDLNAPPSDRLVQLSTIYGISSATPDTSNTLSIFKPLVGMAPDNSGSIRVAEQKSAGIGGSDSVTALLMIDSVGLPVRRLAGFVLPEFVAPVLSNLMKKVISLESQRPICVEVLPADSRGPPVV